MDAVSINKEGDGELWLWDKGFYFIPRAEFSKLVVKVRLWSGLNFGINHKGVFDNPDPAISIFSPQIYLPKLYRNTATP